MTKFCPFDVVDVGLYVEGKGSGADGEVVALVVLDVDGEPGWTGDGDNP